ncbi:MAG: hypothetical protein FWC23_06060 [Chitinispirillia bacterium]|nr:hypothetical protein [Chitinispirillia bacterium]MCL2268731.1 hypothetical protein [Chitinispirillia bacterium]
MNTKNETKTSSIISKERFTMKKLFLFVLALAVCASAAEESLEGRVDGLQAQIDRAMAKAGINFSGEFRANFLNSTVSGDDVLDPGRKVSESVEYTSVDFDIVARPNTALSARAKFRMHQDWRIFFSDVQNPITTRWLSIDGSLMQGIVKYNLGDYTKKLTPLTLWAPELDLLYEPEIFAAGRRFAMSEAFLGGNNRVLQGVNIEFGAELYPLLKQLQADVFGARLASSGNMETGVLPFDVNAAFDKYLLGFNLSSDIMDGLSVGVSDILIYDYLESYVSGTVRGSEDAAKLASQSTNVFAGRLSADTRLFMPSDFIKVGLRAEGAFSADKRYGADAEGKAVAQDDVTGMAINAGLFAHVTLGEGNEIEFAANFVNNESAFRNDAAQTPTFFSRDIMNAEQQLGSKGFANPFDAMYRTVFKYAPSQYFGGTKPYGKNAWNNAVVAAPVGGYEDAPGLSVFQHALSGGMATANRTGPVVDLSGSFLDKGVTVGAKIAMVNNVDEIRFYEGVDIDDDGNPVQMWSRPLDAEFMDVEAGAGFDIAKFVPVVGPSLKIYGSYGMFNAKYVNYHSTESALLSAGLDYQFATRFSVLFGYQQLATTAKDGSDNEVGTLTFDNMAFGLGYKVADGGSLVAKITMTSGKSEPNGGAAVDYKAFQPELFLTVKF